MADYIPGDEAGKIHWLGVFAPWIGANGATHGFSPAEITDFVATAALAPVEVDNYLNAQAAARTALATKHTAINTAIEQARDFAQRLQNDPNTTDADRAAAGITIRDTEPTKSDENDILTTPAPLLKLNFSVRRQVTIHWGPNPGDERHNGRPAGTIGCEVQAALGGIPTDESLWVPFDVDTQSPLIHVVDETTPKTYAYRARYVSKRLKHGPFGDPAVCTVTV